MAELGRMLEHLADDLEHEARTYHRRMQWARFAGGTFAGLALQMWSGSGDGFWWQLLGAVAAAGGYTGYRQTSPTLPWALVDRVILQGGTSEPTPPVGPKQEQIRRVDGGD